MSAFGGIVLQKSKVAGSRFFAKTRNGKQSPIRIDVALSKSPVNLTLDDEVPHIFTRKPRLRPLEFLILGAKRLLQHGVIPGSSQTKAQGISSPGEYEASLMWPLNDGERQWNIMLDWTCR